MGHRGGGSKPPDVLLWAVLVTAACIESWPRWGHIAAGAVLAGLVVVLARWRPAWALSIGAGATLIELADPSGFLLWPALVSAVAGFLAGRRMAGTLPAVAVFAAVGVGGLLVAAVTGAVWGWISVAVPLLFFGVLPWLVGRYVRLRAMLVAAGWQRAEQLERQRRLATREARLRERTRIARDLHDFLGHGLSLIALRAGALELDPSIAERHRVAISGMRAAAVEATERLREAVDVLHDEPDPESAGPAGESIADLVARSRASGLDIDMVVTGPADPVPPLVDRTAYRVVREALTNAARHAPGAPVALRVEYHEAGLTVTVVNDQPRAGGPPAGSGGGRGLLGLRERIRLVGGELKVQQRDGSFEVVAELPRSGVAVIRTDEEEEVDVADATSELARRMAQARGAARRGTGAAVAVLAVTSVSVLLVLVGLRWYEVTHSRLDPARYDALRVGQPRSGISGGLPPQEVDGRPNVPEPALPPGARCEYYRVTRHLFSGPIDTYRLCFVDGVLIEKTFVPGQVR